MNDDDFVERLRESARTLAPRTRLDVAHVVTRARRRRTASRAVGVATVAAVVVGAGAWAADARPWVTGRAVISVPAATFTPRVDPVPSPSPWPSTTAAIPTGFASAPGTAGDYWYVQSLTTTADGETERSDTWRSRELPGLLVSDEDLTTASGVGPVNAFGSFVIDGVRDDMLRDPGRLPTDPSALATVLRDSLQPDRGAGTDDQKVFTTVRDLMLTGGLLSPELRHALFVVASDLPGAEAALGVDTLGRSGTALQYAADEGGVRLVVDPGTGLLLESSTPHDTTVYVTQHAADSLPVVPTLENAGCVSWETC